MARKNGCPMTVRDWAIDILSRASTKANPTWIRIKGLTSMTLSTDADTEDGSSAESLWGEPYVTKRNGSLSLEGRPVIDSVTGAQDPGQAELDYYATQGGCDGDATLRIADPYGRAQIIDVVVTSNERSADDTSETRTWDTEIVGEPEEQPYVQVTSIATTPATSANIEVGETESVTVAFTPDTASNQKFSVASADTSKVQVANIDGLNFDIVGVAVTETPVNVVVRTMNNSKEATIAVTVTAGT